MTSCRWCRATATRSASRALRATSCRSRPPRGRTRASSASWTTTSRCCCSPDGYHRAMRAAAFPLGAAVTVAQLEDDPHPVLARLREHEPVSWVPALDGWLVSRRDLAMQAMRDPETFTVEDPRFSTGQVVGPSMLTLEGEKHKRHRDPFARPFRLAAVRERFTAPVAQETDRLIDAIAPRGVAELRRELAGLRAAIEPALERGPQSSLVAAAAGDGGGLERGEVVANAAVLLFGGIETTEGMIANAIAHLLSHPDHLAEVRAEPGLLANAIEESLRLEPAAAVIDRYATRDVELAGAPIGERELVVISIAGANRDPSVFPDPDRFDVRRPNAKLHV